MQQTILQAIRERVQASGAGKRRVIGDRNRDIWVVEDEHSGRLLGVYSMRADAELVAHAPEDLLLLLERVEKLQREIIMLWQFMEVCLPSHSYTEVLLIGRLRSEALLEMSDYSRGFEEAE